MSYTEGTKQSPPKNEYFATMEAKQCVAVLRRKADDWFSELTTNNYIEKVQRCWKYYHGIFYDGEGHDIQFGGEQGELVNLPVNHFRNIAQHMLVMVTANRPAFQAQATNSDYKSVVQANLANGLLDYYMRDKRLDRFLRDAVEYAIVMGSGYIKMEWDATKGEAHEIETDEDGDDEPIFEYEGDATFRVLSPFDVVFDSTKEHEEENDWVITRTWVNKYNLAKKYYEQEEEIKALKTKDEMQNFRMNRKHYDETDDIAVYEFYHLPCETLPYGRYVMFTDSDIVLYDSKEHGAGMPYRKLPIYRISPSTILGTPYGYSPMFDILPLQDAVNSLYSTILTNQNAFGVQSILNPRGSDISVTQLMGGLNVIDYNPMVGAQGGGKPEPFNPTATPGEIFNFLQMLERTIETLSSVNPVVRGDANAIQQLGARSGNALALIQAQSLQFMSGLQQSYIHLVEDVGTGLISLLKDFASLPRVAAIAGESYKSEMREFTGNDLDLINRISVDVGNALSQSIGGKVQMADNMLQMFGPEVMSPQDYLQVMTTGRLDAMTDSGSRQGRLVKDENERLVDGTRPVKAAFTDQHKYHIESHRDVLSDTNLKMDEELVQRVMEHIQEHIELLKTTDPDILIMLGEQPLGQQPPPQGGGAPGGAGPDGQQGGNPDIMQSNEQTQKDQVNRAMPAMATPAQSPDGNPVLAQDMVPES